MLVSYDKTRRLLDQFKLSTITLRNEITIIAKMTFIIAKMS